MSDVDPFGFLKSLWGGGLTPLQHEAKPTKLTDRVLACTYGGHGNCNQCFIAISASLQAELRQHRHCGGSWGARK